MTSGDKKSVMCSIGLPDLPKFGAEQEKWKAEQESKKAALLEEAKMALKAERNGGETSERNKTVMSAVGLPDLPKFGAEQEKWLAEQAARKALSKTELSSESVKDEEQRRTVMSKFGLPDLPKLGGSEQPPKRGPDGEPSERRTVMNTLGLPDLPKFGGGGADSQMAEKVVRSGRTSKDYPETPEVARLRAQLAAAQKKAEDDQWTVQRLRGLGGDEVADELEAENTRKFGRLKAELAAAEAKAAQFAAGLAKVKIEVEAKAQLEREAMARRQKMIFEQSRRDRESVTQPAAGPVAPRESEAEQPAEASPAAQPWMVKFFGEHWAAKPSQRMKKGSLASAQL